MSQRHAKPVAFVALLVVEVLAITFKYDAAILARETHWSAWLFGYASLLVHPGLAMLVCALLFGGKNLTARVLGATRRSQPVAHQVALFAGHAGSYAALWFLTHMLLGGESLAPPRLEVAQVGWLVACGATFGSWLALLIPPAKWPSLVRQGWKALPLGAMVGLAAWGAGEMTEYLWRPLAQATMWHVAGLIRWATPDVVYRPEEYRIGTASFQVEIAASCSGYEGIGLILAFLVAYLWFFRETLHFPQSLALLPIGVVAIWLANVCRIAALVLIGEYYSPQLALGGFHSQAGAFAFAAIGLTLVVVSRRSNWFSKSAVTPGLASPAAPYVMPLIGLLAAAMVTRAVTQGFDGLYPMRVALVAAILWYYHGHLLTRPVLSRQPLAPTRSEAAYVALVGVLVFVLWIVLEPLAPDHASPQQSHADPTKLPPIWAAIWLPIRIIGCVVTVPIAEELAFRGYLMRRLAHADFAHSSYQHVTWFAVVASSAAFGLLHGRWLAGTLAGMLYAHAASRGGHVSHAIVAHGITNFLITVYVCSTGQWSQWG